MKLGVNWPREGELFLSDKHLAWRRREGLDEDTPYCPQATKEEKTTSYVPKPIFRWWRRVTIQPEGGVVGRDKEQFGV
jgi:hypothetical protein